MIRINLANALMKSMETGAPAAGVGASAPNVDRKEIQASAVKVVLIILPIVGLLLFEKSGLSAKEQALTQATQEKATLDAKIAQYSSVDEINQQLKLQKTELDKKVEVMRKIFSMRMQKLNAILVLQKHIPRSAWLRVLDFDGQELKISGTAMTTEDAQIYASLLAQEKELFSNISNKEVKKVEGGKTESFQFEYVGKLRE